MITRTQKRFLRNSWYRFSEKIREADARRYWRQNLAEEKDARRFNPTGKDGMTVPDAARLFACQQIAKALFNAPCPPMKDLFCIRLSIYQAHALTMNHREALLSALPREDLEKLIDLDYVKLNSTVP